MTAGFYRKQDDELFYAPNIVEANGYVLFIEEKDIHDYPVDGWIYAESEEEAKLFFGIEV